MYSSSSSVYSVNHQARALCPQRASTEKSRFITGTCSLHEENEVHVLEYREDSNQIDVVGVYDLPARRALWSIDTSSYDPAMIIMCDQQKEQLGYNVSIWKLPGQSKADLDSIESSTYNGDRQAMDEVMSLRNIDSSMHHVAWHRKKDHHLLLTSASSVSVWTIKDADVQQSYRLAAEDGLDITSASSWSAGVSAWDPHSLLTSATAFSTSLHVIDWRKADVATTITRAHDATIRDVDYNPNKPSMLITCGDDRKVKFWDLRKLSSPTKTLAGHSHYACTAKYNPFHDQLLISGGSDNLVNLWRIASCSSSPLLDEHDPANANASDEPVDVKVRAMDQHEDSVYAVAWSPADAWVYASLSFDGRVVLNHVPSTEKYKILL